MKYAIVIPDGCADEPLDALGGKTPLQAANLPAMDTIARSGQVGTSNNTPTDFPAGSEVANLCLLGYDPYKFFTGRAPLEAAAQGIQLGRHDWAIRCNLVTIQDQRMVDFTADHISSGESAELLAALQAELLPADSPFQFVPGVSYRNLMVYRGNADRPPPFSGETRTSAPHDLTDLPIDDDFPRGPGSDLLVKWMSESATVLADHEINRRRRAAGNKPATHVWLWGIGGAPNLPTFAQRYGLSGAMITAVDLLRGIAALADWPRIEVEGATGYLDTDYAAKGAAAVDALDKYDIMCVHIEAPDEASHEGRADAKVEALQQIDEKIVAPVLQKLQTCGDEYRMLVLPDHPTFCRTKKHTHGMVPITLTGQGIAPDDQTTYDEFSAAATQLVFEQGWNMMDHFIGRAAN